MFTNVSYRYGTRQIFQKKCRNFLKDVGLQSDPELSLFPKAPFFLMIWIVAIRGSWSDKDCSQCSKIFRYWYSNSKYVYFRVLFIFCGMIFCDKKFWWFKFMILEIEYDLKLDLLNLKSTVMKKSAKEFNTFGWLFPSLIEKSKVPIQTSYLPH